jgi:hypothetical protein
VLPGPLLGSCILRIRRLLSSGSVRGKNNPVEEPSLGNLDHPGISSPPAPFRQNPPLIVQMAVSKMMTTDTTVGSLLALGEFPRRPHPLTLPVRISHRRASRCVRRALLYSILPPSGIAPALLFHRFLFRCEFGPAQPAQVVRNIAPESKPLGNEFASMASGGQSAVRMHWPLTEWQKIAPRQGKIAILQQIGFDENVASG